jgi:CXXX repeat modification system protein
MSREDTMKKAPSRKTAKPAKAAKPASKPAAAAPRIVGRVTPKERDEIQALYERRNGLNELVISLQQTPAMLANEAFYEKLVTDFGKTTTRFKKWWEDKAKAYGWETAPGGNWTINFDTCEILLNK